MKPSISVLITGLVFVLILGVGVLASMINGPAMQTRGSEGRVTPAERRQEPREQVECNQGPSQPLSSDTHDLDNNAASWGVFCEVSPTTGGLPTWVKKNVGTPSMDGSS